MAIAYQSVQTTTGTAASTVTVTKPISLAVGDLMIAHFVTRNNPARTISDETGWTAIGSELTITDGSTVQKMRAFYKIADSGDVAASNFTFDFSGSATVYGGAIYRFTGHNPNTPIDDSEAGTVGASNNPSFGFTIDPTYADSMLLFLVMTNNDAGGAQTYSNFAVATSNPTWTIDYNLHPGTDRLNFGGAHASRAQDTATGDWSFTTTASTTNSGSSAVGIAIKSILDVTVSPSVIAITASVPDETVSGGAEVSPSVVSVTAAVQTPSRNDQALWSPEEKSSTTSFTNTPKS